MSKTHTKNDLARFIKREYNKQHPNRRLTGIAAAALIDIFIFGLRRFVIQMLPDERLEIRNFGVIECRWRKNRRNLVNPKTQEARTEFPARKIYKLKFSHVYRVESDNFFRKFTDTLDRIWKENESEISAICESLHWQKKYDRLDWHQIMYIIDSLNINYDDRVNSEDSDDDEDTEEDGLYFSITG